MTVRYAPSYVPDDIVATARERYNYAISIGGKELDMIEAIALAVYEERERCSRVMYRHSYDLDSALHNIKHRKQRAVRALEMAVDTIDELAKITSKIIPDICKDD